jgi:hypothetical protein
MVFYWSNDLTQLTLGLDRDSALVAHLYDERNPVKKMLEMLIKSAKKMGVKVGICDKDHRIFLILRSFSRSSALIVFLLLRTLLLKQSMLFMKQNNS